MKEIISKKCIFAVLIKYCNIILLVLLCIFQSCSKKGYNYVNKKGTPAQKLEMATQLYNKGKYTKALPLLEESYNNYKLKSEGESIYFMLANAHYKSGDFYLASYYFENFAKTYTLSQHVEESSFLQAVCEYEKSLPHYLDQTATLNATLQFQLFIDQFPDSKKIEICNSYIDKLRSRLHKKSYEAAKLYYNIGDYKAAIVSFKYSIKDYPDIPQRIEMEYLIVKSSYLFAKNSIPLLQNERYEKAVKELNIYKKEHQIATQYDKSILEIEKQIQLELAKLNKINTSKQSK